MGSCSSKKNELPPEVGVEKDNNCSKSIGVRMARGASMAVNPAGALIARLIMSSKSNNKNNTTDDRC